MIYQCKVCNKLYNEEDGAIFSKENIILLSFFTSMFFVCKNCMGGERRREFEELKSRRGK